MGFSYGSPVLASVGQKQKERWTEIKSMRQSTTCSAMFPRPSMRWLSARAEKMSCRSCYTIKTDVMKDIILCESCCLLLTLSHILCHSWWVTKYDQISTLGNFLIGTIVKIYGIAKTLYNFFSSLKGQNKVFSRDAWFPFAGKILRCGERSTPWKRWTVL